MERVEGLPSLNANIGMFVMPRRVAIADLCPTQRISSENITNIYGAGPLRGDYWGSWLVHPADNFRLRPVNGTTAASPCIEWCIKSFLGVQFAANWASVP